MPNAKCNEKVGNWRWISGTLSSKSYDKIYSAAVMGNEIIFSYKKRRFLEAFPTHSIDRKNYASTDFDKLLFLPLSRALEHDEGNLQFHSHSNSGDWSVYIEFKKNDYFRKPLKCLPIYKENHLLTASA